MASGRVVIVSGPSGVGKDTVIDAWTRRNPRVARVVSAATRQPRPGEVDGESYLFLTLGEFHRMAEHDEFLEHKEVHGHFYATPAAHVRQLVEGGRIALLKIDVQGAAEVRRKLPGVLSIFLLPPAWEELEKRIRARGTESEEEVARRLRNARDEVAQAHLYAHQVVNDRVEACVERLEEIVNG